MGEKAYPPRKAPTGFLAGSVEPAFLRAGEVEKHRAGAGTVTGFAAERSSERIGVRGSMLELSIIIRIQI